MADNTNEENVDKPTIPQSEELSAEVVTNIKTINPSTETDNMEVPHHTHASHGKKSWKSYAWEFVMLFLAVFCGFLAEYQLEHVVEHNKEKQYMQTMVQDIKEDTMKLRLVLEYQTEKLAAFDSLLKTIYSTPYTDSSIKLMYYLYRKYTGSRNTIPFTKRTITQLKYSGGLRLIRNRAASDSIVNYDENCEAIEKQGETFVVLYQLKAREFAARIFDAKYLLGYGRENVDGILKTNATITLLSYDKNLLAEYANWIYSSRGVLNSYVGGLKYQQKSAINVMAFLKKEYSLE